MIFPFPSSVSESGADPATVTNRTIFFPQRISIFDLAEIDTSDSLKILNNYRIYRNLVGMEEPDPNHLSIYVVQLDAYLMIRTLEKKYDCVFAKLHCKNGFTLADC